MTGISELAALSLTKPLDRREFEQIRQLAYRTFGLDLNHGKQELVSARLNPLLRQGGFRSFQEYYRHILREPTGSALRAMVAQDRASCLVRRSGRRTYRTGGSSRLLARPAAWVIPSTSPAGRVPTAVPGAGERAREGGPVSCRRAP